MGDCTMTAREVLLKAADYIAEFGHRQSDYGDAAAGQPCCVIGAMHATRAGHVVAVDARLALVRHLGLSQRNTVGTIVDWNDAPGRTADEVIAALRAAAEACNG